MERQEILRNSGYWTAKIQIALFNLFELFMKENKLNRTKLAKKLGYSKGYITQVLNGDYDHRLSKFVELSLSIGKIPKVEFVDIAKVINNEKEGTMVFTFEVQKPQTSAFINQSEAITFKIPQELTNRVTCSDQELANEISCRI